MTEKMIKGLDSLDRAKDVAFSPVQSTALPEETLTVTEEEEAAGTESGWGMMVKHVR